MNERIKELLCQAYDQAVPETWTTLSSEQLERVYEKFAKLIVLEVLNVQENLMANGHNAWHLHKPTKKHFEIEE